ncbi:MAG TPA: redoxin family protein [Planctomycetota bacterium]|nr:redoxin family protein [Planctomycetota bacterium]
MSARIALASAAMMLTAVTAFAQRPADAAAKAPPSLVVGKPAPALTIDKWVKGAPVASFEKNKTYVVEFWATWCGPCIAGMPHLSTLQREYKDKGVTIIGVTSLDKNNPLTAVEAMVKDKGDGMDYTVAWDPDRKTNEAYMKAAQRGGIPCSFVVDGTGTIVYIGHPMYLDPVMEQVVAGKWDVEKGNAWIKDAETKMNGIYNAMSKEPQSAAAKISEFEAAFPVYANLVSPMKFDALLAVGDYEGASKAGAKLVDEAIAHKNTADLNRYAWAIVDPQKNYEKRDLDLALRAAEKAVAFTSEKDAAILDTLARVWFLKGDFKKAVEWQTKAAAVASEGMKKDIEATLAEYKAKNVQ